MLEAYLSFLRQQGAELTAEGDGYFNSILSEVECAHRHPMLCALPYLGALKVSGADAASFLQGQLTCDMQQVTATQGQLGAYCNPQGRIISLFYAVLMDKAYYLIMPQNIVQTTLNALQKYAIFSKVVLSDARADYGLLGVRDDAALPHYLSNMALSVLQTQATQDFLIWRLIDKKPRYLLLGH